MERLIRKPFQGIANIIRFNWHYYVIAFLSAVALFSVSNFLSYYLSHAAMVIAVLIITSTVISLLVSYYIYDYSDLYTLDWLNILNIGFSKQLVNINAGFDETSALLSAKYPTSVLTVLDFYDANKHTEVSIKRARRAYPVFPGTIPINTSNLALSENSVDYAFLIFAGHEIRSDEERTAFFKQIKDALMPLGKIIVTEHRRDINNFMAYNLGFFHFLSEKTWKETFAKAGLSIEKEIKLTPFTSTFILVKNGITP
jgi:hypothetical protein